MSKTTEYIIDLHNLQQQIEELKEDREVVYDTACKLVQYLEDNDYIIEWAINDFIATIQNYSK